MHFEVELALVIGKMVRDLHADDRQGALEAINGRVPSSPPPRFGPVNIRCRAQNWTCAK